MKIQKNGFLYIYTSNESAVPVYFDNLIITHNIGPLVEENQYYPSGIKMAAISSRAFTDSVTPVNKQLFTGKELENSEFSDGWNLDWYDMGARMYDPQIGRFLTHDPHADQYMGMTPYNYAFNNPASYNDPTGKDGKMTGSGTETDPYIISANYYYQWLGNNYAAQFPISRHFWYSFFIFLQFRSRAKFEKIRSVKYLLYQQTLTLRIEKAVPS